ncbi:MAG: hypothetical protein ACK41T_10685 [Pseudobdellovibrio sp.]
MNFNIKFFLSLIFVTIFSYAQEGIVRIPLKTFNKQAGNLVSQDGKQLSYAQLAALYKQGQDLSKLQPTEDKYWQNKKYSAVDQSVHSQMPNVQEGVIYDSDLGANRELGFYSINVRSSKSQNERYILTMGLQVHASLLRAALLRKLGYYQNSPKYFPKLKVTFKSKEEKQKFITSAFCEEGPSEEAIDCLSISPFKTTENKREFLSEAGENALYIHGIYLEKMDADVPSLFDGLTPARYETIPYFSQSRQFRSLLVPFVVADVQESVNRFSTQAVMIRDGWAFINFGFPQYFQETNYDDVRWILRRLAELTDSDWDEIVEAAQYPKSFSQLIKAKLLYRTRNLVNTFFSEQDFKALFKLSIPSLNYRSSDGYVDAGRVTTEYVPGYPQRFSHGERKSPFESGDFLRYMTIKAQSSLLGTAVNELNKKVYKTQVTSTETKGFRLSSRGISPVGSATGRQYGLGFNASRFVTTGTFYGSQAPVQLIDNVSINAGIGVFKVIEDFNGITNNMGANVGYARDFTHVRPILSMKEVQDIPWKEVYVPSKLDKLGSPLKDGNVAQFVANLQVGEVFTITESIGVAGRFGYETGLDNLISFTASTIPTIGLSAGGNRIILRQTQFTRTAEGLQVFLRNQNGKVFDVSFDFNYYINLLKIKHETTLTDLHTDAFILNFNRDLIKKVENVEVILDPESEAQKEYDRSKNFSNKLAGALRALILQSSADQLYSNFKKQQFSIDHGLKTKEIKTKLLWYRSSKLEEEHLLRIYKPELTNVESGQVNNKPIEVVTYKKGKMTGRDYLGFGLNILDWGLKEKLKDYSPVFSQDTQNPSQMPYGRAQWHIIRTDTELTKDREGALPSVSVIQNVWGGWSLKKKDLDKIISQIVDRFKGTKFENKEIIPPQVFNQTRKVDFFRITENLSLLPTALDKIKSLVILPELNDTQVDKAKYLSRLFQKLSEVGKNNKANPQDKVIFNNILSIIGGGDESKGRQIYMQQCKANASDEYNGKSMQHVGTNVWMKGTQYECLETWTSNIIALARKFAKSDLRVQNKLMAEIIYELEENIPLPVLLTALGEANYLYFIEVTGFRSGDEDADQGFYVSNVIGEPAKKHPYSNGLISVFAEKSKIVPIELDRTQGSFQ